MTTTDPGSPILPSPELLDSTASRSIDDVPTPSHSPAMKLNRLPGAFPRPIVKMVYPRPPSIDLRTISFRVNHELDVHSPIAFDQMTGTPDLSALPGAFIASPVLPTTFADFGHSPLPTPPTRFTRVRKNLDPGSLSPGNLSMYSTAASSPTSSSTDCLNSSTTTSAFAAVLSSMPSSPVGTPTLSASSLFSSSAFGEASDVEPSAPSMPVPDSHSSGATAMPAAATTTAAGGAASGMQPALFDAAIASTIIGAVVCLGAVGYLAWAFLRRRVPKVARGSDDGGHDEKGRYFSGDHSQIGFPQAPPLARLSFQRSREQLHGGEETFRADFDQWVDCDETLGSRSREQTEEHGRYPEMARRSGSFHEVDRRASRGSFETSNGRQVARRRSSLRASTPVSITESTFSRQSVCSSRTSHGISPTPPRLPSPVGLRYSGDAALLFSTPPETATKQQQRRTATAHSEEEPPVPVVPLDFRALINKASVSPPRATRSRSSSKSSGTSKSGKSFASVKSGPGSRTRTTTSDDPAAVVFSPADECARKAEKRRATIDGTVSGDGMQALLFQAQLVVASAEEGIAQATSTADPFAAALDKKFADRLSLSQVTPAKPARTSSLTQKVRPATLPAIVVSDHPQELVPPPTPVKVKTASASENDGPSGSDPRMSMKMFDTMPWLTHSPSSNSAFTLNFSRDDISILDPDMRSQRHVSADSARTATGSFAARFSTDSSAVRQLGSTLFEDVIAPRSDDDRSLTCVEDSGLDADDEQMLRTRRRRTLLYSVYQQRGISIDPAGSSTFRPVDTSAGAVETLNSGVMSKRQSLVSSFPSPPTPSVSYGNLSALGEDGEDVSAWRPESSQLDADLTRFSKASFDLDLGGFSLDRIESTDSLRALARSKTYGTIASARSEADLAGAHNEFVPSSHMRPPPSLVSPPAHPPKSSWRKSASYDNTDTDVSSSSFSNSTGSFSSPSRIPLSSTRVSPAQTSTTNTPATSPSPLSRIPSPAPRSFAADLQASVGSPASGYDSDTLLSYHGIRPFRKLTDSLYSSHSASIESLEDDAIARAETVRIGGPARNSSAAAGASDIPRYSSSSRFRKTVSGASAYESDDSAYPSDSEAEVVGRGWGGVSSMRDDDRMEMVREAF